MKRRTVLVLAFVALTLAGCSPGQAPAGTAPTPTPTTVPALAEPIELDYPASLVVDDGSGRTLVTDWNAQQLRAIDSAGEELWSMDAVIDDERGGAEAYSAGESVIVHDYSGTTTAYSWADGSEQWSFTIPGDTDSCHLPQSFGSQTTGTNPILGERDLILLTYLGVSDEPGCTPSSAAGDITVIALDATTGNAAWPALTIGPEGRTFGGTEVNISPDRTLGYLSWADGEDSMLTRIDLASGDSATVSLTAARSLDQSGLDYYDVFPTTDPTSLLYLYGSEDPDDPVSSAITRTAELTVPDGLQPSDSTVLSADGSPTDVTMQDTFDPGCTVDLSFTPAGRPTCVNTQLFASTIKYQGSDGSPQGWFADAPQRALNVVGFPGAPQAAPVDAGDRALVIVPGLDDRVMALDAATGETVWSAGDLGTAGDGGSGSAEGIGADVSWGGQGVLAELGLVVVTDEQTTSFYEAETGKPVSEHPASEYATLSSGTRFVLVAEEASTMMWAVVDR